MYSLVLKEVKDFWANSFGLFSVGVLIFLAFLFLWIFPDSSYLTYGIAEGDLYFQFMSYLLLLVVPAYAVGFLSNEYRFGTEELLRSLSINWRSAITAKFIAALLILVFIILLTSVHLVVLNILSMDKGGVNFLQVIGSYIGLLGIGACYIAISLMVTSFIEQTTASFIISVFICFILFTGLSLISALNIFEGGMDYWIDRLSLSYHSDQIGKGILRLSSMVYFVLLIIWNLWVAAHRLNTKEV